MKTYKIQYKEYDDEGRVAFHNMTVLASDEQEAERKFYNTWGMYDVHIIKIEEI